VVLEKVRPFQGRIDLPMRKDADCPMALADAALVRVAEREGLRRFFTVDRQDFAVYRMNGKIRPIVLP
jgi:predicted nucleic acid-binding protein